ncbi:hypothetical protein BH24ACT3_BH24ACT3_18370 [soil metagenome]
MFDAIATVLAWFYDLVPSYAVAIALLTLSIMVLLTPLTLKGTRSMMAMQRLQPEMKKLQAKYKDDRQKLNEEMLKFYRENKINPVGGCLPLLIQAPVFIVLYQVLIKLTQRGPYGDAIGGSVGCGIGGDAEACADAVYTNAGTFHPSYLDPTSSLFESLNGVREMVSFGIDLSESTQQALSDSFVHALPYLVLILGVTATSYIQQKQVSGRNPNAPVNPQQQMLLKLMPAFFAFISVTLPAGVFVYFLVSNLYRMGQQAFISHTMYNDDNDTIAATSRVSDKSSTSSREGSDGNGAQRPKGILGALGLSGGGRGDGPGAPAGKSPAGKSSAGKSSAGKKPAGGTAAKGASATKTSKAGQENRSAQGNGAAKRNGAAAAKRPPAQQHRAKKKKKRK